MKKLIIDARMVGPIGHGISKYIEGALANFGDSDPLTQLLLKYLNVKSFQEIEVISIIRPNCPEHSPIHQYKTIELDLSCYDPRSWWAIPKLLKLHDASLYFNPTFASFPRLPCKYVQTIHDLNHLHFGGILHRLYYSILLKKSIRKAEAIFTVSNFIKSEIAKWSKISPDKILVFYNQFSPFERVPKKKSDAILSQYGLAPKKYFFCVTNQKPHKNLDFLIAAYRAYQGQNSNKNELIQIWARRFEANQNEVNSSQKLPLVVTVKPEKIPPSTQELGVMGLGGISDENLHVLYQECAGFYFPSLYEGFGRPPVEAALAGVKTIVVSDLPVHHEAESLAQAHFLFLGVSSC